MPARRNDNSRYLSSGTRVDKIELGKFEHVGALAVLCLTFFLVALDNTIVNVALPSLQRSLGSSTTALQWITDAYTTAFAGLIVVGGHLADRRGRREVLQSGLLAFIIGSLVAIFGNTNDVVIVARMIMGVGAALAVPASLSMLVDVFHSPIKRQTAIAGWTASAGIGVAMGPLVGGALLAYFWWGSIFWANIVVAGLALAVSWVWLPKSAKRRHEPLDWKGSLLSVVALTSLVGGIIQAPEWGWSQPRILGLFLVSAVAGGSFVVRAKQNSDRIVNFSIVRRNNFALASLAMGAIYLGIFGFLFLMTQFLQSYLGYSAFGAGLRFLPAAAAVVVGSALARVLAPKLGPRLCLALGLVLMLAAIAEEVLFSTSSTYLAVVGILVPGGVSMGFVLTVGTDAVMGSLSDHETGIGAAINVAAMEVGGALGVALFGSVFNSEYARQLAPILAQLPQAAAGLVASSLAAGLTVSRHIGGALGVAVGAQAHTAFMAGFAFAGWVGVSASALAALWVTAYMSHHSHDANTAVERDLDTA